MPLTEAISGTAAISSTEVSLATNTSYDTGDAQTDDGVYQFFLDVSDMIAGDQIEIKIYEKVRSSDSQKVIDTATLTGPQSNPIWVSVSLLLLHGWDITCKAVSGTVTINWSIRKAT